MENQTELYRQALMLACQRVADSPQKYHEANTAAGWRDVFIEAARTGRTTDQVLESRPSPRMMKDTERQMARLLV